MQRTRLFPIILCTFCLLGMAVLVAEAWAQRGGSRGGGGGGGIRAGGGGAISRPSGGGAISRPSGGGAISRPSGGGAISRPSGGGAISRPSGGGGASWGNGNVVHHELASADRAGARVSDRSNFTPAERPNLDPDRGRRTPTGQGERPARPDRADKTPSDSDAMRQMLQDRGFNKPSELRRALDAKGLHGPDDVKKAVGEHGELKRDNLHKALSEKGLDPSKVDRSKIADSVRKRSDIRNNEIGKRTINVINNNFFDNHKNFCNQFNKNEWYHRHPGAWHPPHPVPPHAWWGPPCPWNRCWGWFTAGFITGFVVDRALNPIWYDYGSNIYYVDNTVYVNGTSYVSAEEYYDQAHDLAASGSPVVVNISLDTGNAATSSQNAVQDAGAGEEEWLPLGLFAVLKDPEQKECNRVLQLAVDKSGKVAGNLIEVKEDKQIALFGAVDPKTQRVAFRSEDNDEIVAECGLANLTKETLTMLIHVGKDKTEERTLVRLNEPTETGE